MPNSESHSRSRPGDTAQLECAFILFPQARCLRRPAAGFEHCAGQRERPSAFALILSLLTKQVKLREQGGGGGKLYNLS